MGWHSAFGMSGSDQLKPVFGTQTYCAVSYWCAISYYQKNKIMPIKQASDDFVELIILLSGPLIMHAYARLPVLH
jgi:hypothetical protein